jgi:sugar O-acyltransferase (sialic acid O-acetyltransferase NeuD family)
MNNKENIIIYGNGRIAKILSHYLSQSFNVKAFTVDDEFIVETSLEGISVVPFSKVEILYPPEDYKMFIAVGYVQMNDIRALKFNEATEKGYKLPNYVHSSVHIHKNFKMGSGNIILDHVSVQPYSSMGDNNIIWSNAVIAHGCQLGDTNWVTSGTVIAGDSILKSQCFLGINCTVGHNVTVEDKSFIGANTAVTKNTQPGEVYISKDGIKYRLDSSRFLKFAGV